MITVGTKGDNQPNDTKSQESSKSISTDEWLISIDEYAGDTADKPRIQRIPSLLREIVSNKNCYDPLVVSIGPYHHGNEQLKAFEKLKIPVAHKFVRACSNSVSIKQLYEEVANVGKSARECYEEVSTDDELFNRIMFLDACFVLHFMFYFEEKEQEVDPLQPWSCYFEFVQRDLFLLENQIPLLVLKVLMKFRYQSDVMKTRLIKKFLDQKAAIMPPQESSCTNAVKKFLAKMMGCSDQKKEEWELDMAAPHLLHLVRKRLIGSSPEKEKEKEKEKKPVQWHFRSVMELKSAGIHFRPSQTTDITDVKFKPHIIFGTLTLPPLVVNDLTKSFLLNLAAYEMCPRGDIERSDIDRSITSYVYLMDSLIDHADDVKELRKKGILVNDLGSDEELAQLFNEIGNNLLPDPRAYEDVIFRIENHCKSKGQVWMAEWLHNHFSSPWTLLAFLGAILALALTMVQTYFAVFEH